MKPFHVAVVTEGIDPSRARCQPWMIHLEKLEEAGIHVEVLASDAPDVFDRPYDAMMLYVWQDSMNPRRFDAERVTSFMARHAAYRARFPETRQIILNHTDMSRSAMFSAPYWRPGDPVLFRTPAYDRSCLAPFPPEDIWPFEMVWGRPRFARTRRPRFRAAFIGTPTGPEGYRQAVAAEVRKVGLGLLRDQPIPQKRHDAIMSRSQIIVCPRGWGEQSVRHWDSWLSGKPVLTDNACHQVEMIPGVRLEKNVHYLVFDDPAEIPDIVSDWTRPGRAADLEQIAENGRQAALRYDAFANILRFFRHVRSTEDMPFVSVIVPSYRPAGGLARCLDALAAQSYPRERTEVIVVDNGRSELDAVRKGQVHWASEPTPGSYAARNRGVSEARGDLFAFTDADCVPAPGWLTEGVRRWRAAPADSVIAGKIEMSFRGRDPGLFELFDALFLGFPQDGFARDGGFAATANMLCGRSLFEKTGAFNEKFRSGGDYEWGRRANAAGAGIHYEAAAVVVHPARSSFLALLDKVRRLSGGVWLLSHPRGGRGRRLDAVIRNEFGRWRGMRERLREAPGLRSARRVQLAAFIAVFQTARIVELLRLAAGGTPRR